MFERYQKREELFAQLHSMRYRAMAVFGSTAAEPFDNVFRVRQEIFTAANMLGTHYWVQKERDWMTADKFKEHLKEMEKHEAVFWQVRDDEISARVRKATETMESITRQAVASQSGLFQDFWSWIKGLVNKR